MVRRRPDPTFATEAAPMGSRPSIDPARVRAEMRAAIERVRAQLGALVFNCDFASSVPAVDHGGRRFAEIGAGIDPHHADQRVHRAAHRSSVAPADPHEHGPLPPALPDDGGPIDA
jgi:hypothetical protein